DRLVNDEQRKARKDVTPRDQRPNFRQLHRDTPRRVTLSQGGRCSAKMRLTQGKTGRKRGALPFGGHEVEGATVGVHDGLTVFQTKTSAAVALGGVEGFKHMGLHVLGDAAAVVLHADSREVAV